MSRAVVCTRIGPYKEVLSLRQVQQGEQQQGQELGSDLVKVRVLASGLAFPDILVVEGKHMMKRTPPFVPGSELCGEVVGIGEDVQTVAVGDRIFGTALTGTLSEFALLREEDCHCAPPGVSAEVCAGFELNYGTTWHALVDLGKLAKGECCLILGASGGIGMSAIDICKAHGARVVACASTEAKLRKCALAGADELINYSGKGGLKAKLKDAGLYGNIDVVLDPVGGSLSEVCLRALGWGGRFLVIGFAAGGANPKTAIPKVPLNLALLNERHIIGCFWGAWKMQHEEENRANIQKMMKLIQQGKLKPLVEQVYPFEQYMEAMDQLMHRRAVGKVVVKVARDIPGAARL